MHVSSSNITIKTIRRSRNCQPIRGATLIEALITIVVVGVLGAIAAPSVSKIGSNPLVDTTNLVASGFRATRTMAISQTSPIKIKPKGRQAIPSGTSVAGINTEFEIYRATSTNVACNAETGWALDRRSSITEDYLTFGKANVSSDKRITLQAAQVDGVALTSATSWEICFNTRGMASTTTTRTNDFVGNSLVLTLQEGSDTTQRRRIEIFPAGGVQVYDN